MLLRIIIITLPLLINACGTAVYSIKKDQILEKGNGVLLTKFHTNYHFDITLIDTSGQEFRFQLGDISGTEALLAVSLPAGRYSIYKIRWGNRTSKFIGDDPYQIAIVAGKINYVCDLGIYFKLKEPDIFGAERTPNIEYIVPINFAPLTQNEFKQKYPGLSEKYPLVISPITKCVSSDSNRAQQYMHIFNKDK